MLECDLWHMILCNALLVVMLQPFEFTKSDYAPHKLMVQFFFLPAGDVKPEDAVSIY